MRMMIAGFLVLSSSCSFAEGRAANYRCSGGAAFSVIHEAGGVLVMMGGGAYRLNGQGAGFFSDGRGQTLALTRRGAQWRSGGKAQICRQVAQ